MGKIGHVFSKIGGGLADTFLRGVVPGTSTYRHDTENNIAHELNSTIGEESQSALHGATTEYTEQKPEIEKTRFGPRLRYEITIPEALQDANVPPLALQSLVENAVKHVVSERSQGATIHIHGSEESGRILLEVSDDGPGFSLDSITPEHGLGNLIARLDLLFGGAGQLEVARENDRTIVRLSFPA